MKNELSHDKEVIKELITAAYRVILSKPKVECIETLKYSDYYRLTLSDEGDLRTKYIFYNMMN